MADLTSNHRVWHIYVGAGQPDDGKLMAGAERFVKFADYEDLQRELRAEQEAHADLQSKCYDGQPTHSSVFDEVTSLQRDLRSLCEHVGHWATAVQAVYGELDTKQWPGPPTSLVKEMRSAVEKQGKP